LFAMNIVEAAMRRATAPTVMAFFLLKIIW
jgi:hypothetical protein